LPRAIVCLSFFFLNNYVHSPYSKRELILMYKYFLQVNKNSPKKKS